MDKKRPILVVDDDQVDIMTIKRALRENDIQNDILTATNGEKAIDVLENESKKPNIILLDLNMPKMNGIEFLKVIKRDQRYKNIPVVVLTSSKEMEDIRQSFELGVAGYMVKPIDYLDFHLLIKKIIQYWEMSEFAY